MAAEDHRHRMLHGAWVGIDVLYEHGAPTVERCVRVPERFDCVQVLVEQHTAARVINAEHAVLLLDRADADAELEPSAGEVVERRPLLGDDDGVALGEQQYASA